MGFKHGVEAVVPFDNVPTPGAVADVDGRSRRVEHRVVAHRDPGRHGDIDAAALFFNPPAAGQQVVFHQAISGVFVGLGADFAVHRIERVRFGVVAKARRANRGKRTHKADIACPVVFEKVAAHHGVAVVPVHKHPVAAQLFEVAVFDGDVLGAADVHGATAVDRPVALQQRLAGVHEGAAGRAKAQTFEPDPLNRRLGFRRLQCQAFDFVAGIRHLKLGHLGLQFAVNLNQMWQTHDLHHGLVQVHGGLGHEVQRV